MLSMSRGLGALGDHLVVSAAFWESGRFKSEAYALDPRSGRLSYLLAESHWPALGPDGALVFSRGSGLFAAPFDARRLEVTGQPVALLDGLRTGTSWSHGIFDLIGDALFYWPGGVAGARRIFARVGGDGHPVPLPFDPAAIERLVRLSPDGSSVAYYTATPKGVYEVWVLDLESQSVRRLAADPVCDCSDAVWSPDGRWIAYTKFGLKERDGIYVVPADGSASPRRIASVVNVNTYTCDWAHDGSALLLSGGTSERADILALPLGSAADSAGPLRTVVGGPGDQDEARMSPDGRLLAYLSTESGRREVYVTSLEPGLVAGVRIRIAAGLYPQWSPRGHRLFYLTPDSRLSSVEISLTPRLSAGTPRQVLDFDASGIADAYDVLPDGNLIVVLKDENEGDIREFRVVLGFDQEIRRKMRAAR
jgi:Tol biopolymer transport system component